MSNFNHQNIDERIKQAFTNDFKELDLSNLSLKQIPKSILKLTRIEKVKLNGNKLKKYPKELHNLKNLKEIDLSFNSLLELPNQILNPKLEYLLIHNNSIKSIPDRLNLSESIKILDLSSNVIEKLPNKTSSFINLEELYLKNNRINKITANYGFLKNLKALDISNNLLKSLPSSLINLKELIDNGGLFIEGNQLNIPPEIISQGLVETIYYVLNEDKILFNEAKMLILGEGNVGKSALVNRLKNDIFIDDTSMTRGINIEKWKIVTNDNTDIKINIWDFGGQEIMHAMHQFFMTKRSLYLLVCNARENNNEKIEHWLKLIKSFGGRSPVIICVNKIDDGTFEPDIRRLKEKYDNIVSYVRTSCLKREGIDELTLEIKKHIVKLPHLNDYIPAKWKNIKNEIEKIQKNYISLDDYILICNENNVKKFNDQLSLLRLLHDLGVAFNFGDKDTPKETNILKPEWVTKGIYDILNSNLLFKRKGKLFRKELGNILSDKVNYPVFKHGVILEIMQKFELCFSIPNEEAFLIPDLLQTDQPPLDNEFNKGIIFQYHYDFLPDSIMPRFIVKSNNLTKEGWYWRNGIILNFDKNKALVRVDKTEKKIYVSISGLKSNAKSLLHIILNYFEEIHASITNLTYSIKIAIPDNPSIYVDFKHLLTLESMGKYEFIPEGMSKSVSIINTLYGFKEKNSMKDILLSLDKSTMYILLEEKEKRLNS